MYKIGDIYLEKVLAFKGFDSEGKVITQEINKQWIIIDLDENRIMCECEGEYKVFQI